MKVTGNKEPYLEFLGELCIRIMSEHGTPPPPPAGVELINNYLHYAISLILVHLILANTPSLCKKYVSDIHLRKRNSSIPSEARWDGLHHWILSTELDQKDLSRRRNCKQCFLEGKKDFKAVFMRTNARSCSTPTV
jgi:hypothetical protein